MTASSTGLVSLEGCPEPGRPRRAALWIHPWTAFLDDLLAAEDVVLDDHGCARCTHCSTLLGPTASCGLVGVTAATHLQGHGLEITRAD